MSPFKRVRPIPCQHIADYYQQRWEARNCIGWNLLRRGYGQWAYGRIERGFNNLYGRK
jgi:hypothetical protein